jgi:hypothetical protein
MLAECLLTAPQIAGDLEWGLNGKDKVLSVWAVSPKELAAKMNGSSSISLWHLLRQLAPLEP